MKVLVTGGAGFIGSHTCKILAAAGHEPVVFDNLSTGHREAVKWGDLVVGNILDRDALDKAIARHRPEAVIHFAALAYVGESMAHPDIYYRTNVAGTLSLLEAMRRYKVDTIVFSSTCATYGIPASLPIMETTPQVPINTYGFTKLVVERMLEDYDRSYGIKFAALRYFNAAGADPDGELGERHEPETHVIPLAIQSALGARDEFSILGTDYDTPDGSAIRDYVHVCDLADAHVRAVEHLKKTNDSDAFNLGTGVGTSVFEIVQAVESATGRKVPVNLSPRRAGDPPALYANAERAKAVLGWKPQYTDIVDTVSTAANWYMKQYSRVSHIAAE